MTQIAVAAICGGIWLATRITKAIAIKKINAQTKTLEQVVVGVNNYSTARKSDNKNVKKAIATQIKLEMPELKKVIDATISKVEGEGPKKGILKVLCNVVFKIINILL